MNLNNRQVRGFFAPRESWFTRGVLVLCCVVWAAWPGKSLWAQAGTVMGASGVLLVPSAETAPDGEAVFGVSDIPTLYANELKPYQRTVYYGRIGYLPFLELTAMLVRPDNYSGGAGDRSAHIKVRLLSEDGLIPAVAVGAQDFFGIEALNLEPAGAQHFAALYAVASKTIAAPRGVAIRVDAGWGRDDLPARTRYLTGPFAAVTLMPRSWFEVLGEYDSQEFNAGLRLHLGTHLHFLVALWKMKELTSGLALSFVLR
ncbi:YjbH domain-containing protein [candidate division KSB1 bacterium]|nr:YjbH domain-containing protein [candidate division KSB1 bacterium]